MINNRYEYIYYILNIYILKAKEKEKERGKGIYKRAEYGRMSKCEGSSLLHFKPKRSHSSGFRRADVLYYCSVRNCYPTTPFRSASLHTPYPSRSLSA